MSLKFLTVGDVCALLRISRSQLQNLYPLLPHLNITVSRRPARQTRLFVGDYVEMYADMLNYQRVEATIATARDFAASMVARAIISRAGTAFMADVTARNAHSPDQVATLLGISRSTAFAWTRSGVFQGVQTTPKGLKVPSASILRAAQWSIPR